MIPVLAVAVVELLSHVRLCDPIDCSLPGSSVHGILQARGLEWVVISSSRGSSRPGDWTCTSCIGRWILYHWATREALWPSSGHLNENENAHRCRMSVSLCHLLGHWTQDWWVSHVTFLLPRPCLYHTRIPLPLPEAQIMGVLPRALNAGSTSKSTLSLRTLDFRVKLSTRGAFHFEISNFTSKSFFCWQASSCLWISLMMLHLSFWGEV